jgi:hypothetical protein
MIVATQEYSDGSRPHAKEGMLRPWKRSISKMAVFCGTSAAGAEPSFGDVNSETLSADCGECHIERGVSHDPLVPNWPDRNPSTR